MAKQKQPSTSNKTKSSVKVQTESKKVSSYKAGADLVKTIK